MLENLGQLLDRLGTMGPGEYLALVVAVSVLCQWIAWRLRMPSILLLLLVGFGLGQIVAPEDVLGRDLLFDGVRLTVGIILFEGSMSLRLKHVHDLGKPVWRLCSATVLLAWAMITATAWLLGFDIRIALLAGAILVVTGPTVINPILRSLRPTRRVSSLLRWEGIVVDPIGAVLALLVFQGVLGAQSGAALTAVLIALGKTLLIAFGIALTLGYALERLMRARAIPDFLHGVAFLAAAVGALMVSDLLQPESGLLTVTILGIYLGNRPDLHLEHVAEFKEHLQILFVGALFVVLAGRVGPADLVAVAPRALIFLAVLVLIVRPVSIALGLWGTNVTGRERTLLAAMAPRGIVAAAVTSIFALGFAEAARALADQAAQSTGSDAAQKLAKAADLERLADQAGQLVPMVFIVIVCTVAIYGFSIGRIADRLGLASAKPDGVVFVGVNAWVIDTARLLQEHGVQVLVIARNHATLSSARMAGLTTQTANILSEYAVKDMDLSGIGYFLACTPEDETNATAAREFAHIFGGANTYQLHRDAKSTGPGSSRQETAGHLTARYAFSPPLSRAELDRRMASGMVVKMTPLTKEFTLEDFHARYGKETVILFAMRENSGLVIADPESRLPTDAGAVIAIVREPALPKSTPPAPAPAV